MPNNFIFKPCIVHNYNFMCTAKIKNIYCDGNHFLLKNHKVSYIHQPKNLVNYIILIKKLYKKIGVRNNCT